MKCWERKKHWACHGLLNFPANVMNLDYRKKQKLPSIFYYKSVVFHKKNSHIPSTGSRLAKNGDVATQLTGHNTIYERAIRNSRSFWCIMWRFFAYESSVVILHGRIFTSNTINYDLLNFPGTIKHFKRRRHVLQYRTCRHLPFRVFQFLISLTFS